MESNHENLIADYQAIIEKLNSTFDEKKLIPPIKEMTDVLIKDLRMIIEDTELLKDQLSLPLEKGGLKKFHDNNGSQKRNSDVDAIQIFNDKFAVEIIPEILSPEYEPPLNNSYLLAGHMHHLWQLLIVLENDSRIQAGQEMLLCSYIAFLKIQTASAIWASQLVKTNKDIADAIRRNKAVKAKRNPQKDYFKKLANKYTMGSDSSRAKNIFNEWDRRFQAEKAKKGADRKGTPEPYSEPYIRKLLGQT